MTSRINLARDNSIGTIISNVATLLSKELLLCFQKFLIENFNVPVSIWTFDSLGQLNPLSEKHDLGNYPKLCEFILENECRQYLKCYCAYKDKSILEKELLIFIPKKNEMLSKIVPCHLGIERILIPINYKNEIIGCLSVAKFLRSIKNKSIITSKINELFSDQNIDKIKYKPITDINITKSKIIELINTIPIYDDIKINHLINETYHYLPLLRKQLDSFNPSNLMDRPDLSKIQFIEKIEKELSNIITTRQKLWEQINSLFKFICINLNLNSALLWVTNRWNYQLLNHRSYYNVPPDSPRTLSFDCQEHLTNIVYSGKGVILPTQNTDLKWLDSDQLTNMFGSENAILYGNRVFGTRAVVLGFGFRKNYLLSKLERIILREVVDKLFQFIRNAMFASEINFVMGETGHMLGRSLSGIDAGYEYFKRFGFDSGAASNQDNKDTIKNAHAMMQLGISNLQLIIKNYYAFGEIQGFEKRERTIEYFNCIIPLKDIAKPYEPYLEQHKISVKYDINVSEYLIYANPDAYNLVILNLIDNAVKFSYDDRYIHIVANTKKEGLYMEFNNVGQGIAEDEKNLVFEPFYRSRYRNRSEDTPGAGYGLTICKRFFDRFYPDGYITIRSSNQHAILHGRWEGDHYLTTVKLFFPKRERG